MDKKSQGGQTETMPNIHFRQQSQRQWLQQAASQNSYSKSKNDISTTINVYQYFSDHKDIHDSDKQGLDPQGQMC